MSGAATECSPGSPWAVSTERSTSTPMPSSGRYAKPDVYDTVEMADARNLPAADGSVGTVFANCVLEHIPEIGSVLVECDVFCGQAVPRGHGSIGRDERASCLPRALVCGLAPARAGAPQPVVNGG